MMEEKVNGLLLQAIPYLAGRRILKVLTADNGLITIMASSKTPSVLTTPFVWAEWVFTKKNKEIHSLKEGTLIDDLFALKQEYERLSAASQIARDLLYSQMPGKNATELLALALACFRRMPLFSHPRVLLASFRLKLLACEGLLDPNDLSSLFLQTLATSRSFQELASILPDEAGLTRTDALLQQRLDFPKKKA